MSSNVDNTIFNSIKSNLVDGNYSISIQTKDILENYGNYADLYSIEIGGETGCVGSPLTITLVIIGSSIFIMVVIRRKKK